MRIKLTILFFILSIGVTKGQVKLITPGEHLGFKLEVFDHQDNALETTISQGEIWTAVYNSNGTFKTKTEDITWDTTQNFIIQSDTTKQPIFYVQGLGNLAPIGEGTAFGWRDFVTRKPLRWTLNKTSYVLLYREDPNYSKLANYEYESINTDGGLVLFKGVPHEQVDSLQLSEDNTVRLFWTGDLNGDGEPDFFLGIRSHHEMPIVELIMSNKINGQVIWKRIARFIRWS